MTDPFAESNAALRHHAAEVARKTQRYQEMREGLAEMSVTETSPDGRVTLTVDAGGVLTDLRLDDEDTRAPGHEISATVLITLRRAQSRLPERAAEIIGALESDPDTVDHALSGYRARFPEMPAEFPVPLRAENGSRDARPRR
ncbi:YbaB/EbfC family nucleoid-associated protein [Amycolatopsis pigmentata]|uniref:YbaB/EbfC family nucleoid-associated protein n=1 Tax=Amycolatopsis pigmentata TaxID=450801 RepID=A0ABW5G0P5_9PSEU